MFFVFFILFCFCFAGYFCIDILAQAEAISLYGNYIQYDITHESDCSPVLPWTEKEKK